MRLAFCSLFSSNRKKAGRVVASRYKSPSHSATPLVRSSTKSGSINNSDGSSYCMTSTPASNAAKPSHNASAITVNRSHANPALKPSTFQISGSLQLAHSLDLLMFSRCAFFTGMKALPTTVRKIKASTTEKNDRKLPVIAMPSKKKCEDDEAALLYNTYLQTYFINKMHGKACGDQELYVQVCYFMFC